MAGKKHSANAELDDLGDFRGRHRSALARAFSRARTGSDVELSEVVFSLRVFEACELAFGGSVPPRGPSNRLIENLHASDLYLASAAAGESKAAQALLRRWYSPLLARRAGSGAEALEEALLGATGSSAPLSRYLGLSSFRRWLSAAVAASMPTPVPVVGVRPFTFADSDFQRVVDTTASRAIATLPARLRVAMALVETAGVAGQIAAAAMGVSARRLRSARRVLTRTVIADLETAMRQARMPSKARRGTWDRLAQAMVGHPTRRSDRAAEIVNAGFRRSAAIRTESCPDANRMLAVIEPTSVIDLAPELNHIPNCWACQNALAWALREAPPPPPRHLPLTWAALIMLAVLAGAALSLFDLSGHKIRQEAEALLERAPSALPTPNSAAIAPPPASLETSVLALGPELPPVARLRVSTPRARPQALAQTSPTDPPPSPLLSPAASRQPSNGSGVVRPQPPKAEYPAPLLAPIPMASPTEPGESAVPTPGPPSITRLAPASPIKLPSLHSAGGDTSAARLVNLALARYLPGQEDQTIGVLRRAIDLDPSLGTAHLNAAILLELKGETIAAEAHWRRFLSLAPNADEASFARERLAR